MKELYTDLINVLGGCNNANYCFSLSLNELCDSLLVRLRMEIALFLYDWF